MTYLEQNWNDGAAGLTPLSAARLEHMEAGIGDASRAYANGFGATEAAEVDVGESTATDVWTNLATVGPQVIVNIGPSGTALVIVSAQMQSATGAPGSMSFEVLSGLGAENPRNMWALRLQGAANAYARASAISFVTGLETNVNVTFKAMYRADTAENVLFNHRVIAVIPL